MMSDSTSGSTDQQLQILDQMLAIGQAVQREITKNPKQVYQLIVETMCRLTGADCTILYPYHPSFGGFYDLKNVAAYGLRYESQLVDRVDKIKGMAARVHQDGEIIREDIEREDSQGLQTSPFIARESIKAFMGLSLKFGDDTIGLLYVDYRETHRFSEEEKRLIRLLGQQAAMAVSNSWAYQLMSIRADAVTKLKTIGQTLATIKDPSVALESILDRIADSAQKVLDADLVDLYQYIQSQQNFILPPTLVGERRDPRVPKTEIYDDDVVIKAVQIGTPQYFRDTQGTAVLTGEYEIERNNIPSQRFVIREGIVSSATIPLMVADETVGIMFVNYRAPQLFGQEQRDLIESFAAQAAVAIHNARLFQKEQAERRQSETLRQAAQFVNSTLERDEVIGLVLDQLGQVIKYSSASVQLIRGDHRFLVGGRGFLLSDSPQPLQRDVSQDPLIKKIVERQHPIVLSDVKAEPLWDYIPETAHIHSWIGVPLIVREQVIGLLTVDHSKAGYYTLESGDVVAAFANQVATAIYNSTMFQQINDQVQALAELNQLAQRLVSIAESPQDIRTLLEQVARSAQQVLKADLIELYEYLRDRNEYRLPPISVGEKKESPLLRDKIYEDDAVFQLIHRETPLYAEDVHAAPILTAPYTIKRAAPSPERFSTREGIESAAAIPLWTGSEVVGLMFASYRTPQTFTAGQKELIGLFANQAAIAIHNSRLFNETLRRRNELQIVDEVSKLLMSTLDPREIPRLLLQQVIRLFGIAGASLWQVDRTDQNVQCLFSLNHKGEEESFTDIVKGIPFELGQGIVGAVAKSGKPLIANQVQGEPQWDRRVDEATGFATKAILAVPLIYQQETIGVIEILNRFDQTFFTEEDQNFLTALVAPAAIALENARLYQRLERRVQALSALNEVGQTLTSGLRLKEDEILDLIYQQVGHLAHTQNVNIALYDEKTNVLTFKLVRERGCPINIEQEQRFTPRQIDKAKVGKTEEIILTGKSILHKTREETAGWYHEPGHRDYNAAGEISASHLAVPMVLGEKVMGVIAIYDWDHEYAYDEQDRQILSVIAGQAAIALDNVNLFQALGHQVEALSALNEVGQALTSGLRLKEDEILELIYEQARKLTNTQDMYIALYDDSTQMIEFKLALEKGQRVEIAAPRRADMKRRGKTEEVIFTKQSILHRTEQESEDWYKLPDHQEFTGGKLPSSWLGVPTMVGERVLGVIAVFDWEREYAFDELDMQVLASMASQAAIALENVRLYTAAREEVIATKQLATLGTVMAAIQHRINNTLNIIGPNITRLRRRVDTTDETIREILDIVERNVRYTSDYIHRIQEPLKETEVQKVDLNASLYDARCRVWQEYESRAGFGPVEVIEKLDNALPFIEASAGQITEIFRNLIENSYKAMGANGGTLTMLSRQVNDWLEVEIQDTGPGISTQINERLFVRPVPSRQPGGNGPGSGLGLWLSALLLQRYGGEIKVAETGTTGTTMLVRLPVLNA